MQNNTEKNRYELQIDGHTAYADYGLHGNVLSIKYVFAPPELRGTGAAGKLMQEIMDNARANKYKVAPICGYAVAWIRKSKKFDDILV